MSRKILRIGATLGAIALTLAACGGGDDTEEPSGETATETEADTETETEGESEGDGGSESAAEPIVLRGLSAFDTNDEVMTLGYHMFQEKVAELSNGELEVTFHAGPESVDPFSFGEVIGGGSVDLGIASGAYTWTVVPEAAAVFYRTNTVEEIRGNGGMELIDEIHRERINATVLGLQGDGNRFALYTQDELSDWSDLEGQRIRMTGAYLPIADWTGAEPAVMTIGEMYTALERGAVSGFVLSDTGADAWGGAHELVNYKYQPSFGQMDIMFYVNLDVWNSLSPEHQEILQEAVLEVEAETPAEYDRIRGEEEEGMLAEAGIEVVELDDEVETVLADGGRAFLRENVGDADVAEQLIEAFLPE